MVGIIQLVIILFILAVDVWINWDMIELQGKRPNHFINWIIRAVLVSFVVFEPTMVTWFLHSLNAAFLYWFVFDTGLNLSRGLKPWYLGDATLDKLQKKYLYEFPSWCFKAIIFLFNFCYIFSNYNV